MSIPPRTLDELVADISVRVRPVVPDMPQADFDAMVLRMARLELKYAIGRSLTPRGMPAIPEASAIPPVPGWPPPVA
jgi:hypothetical protein